MIPEWMIIRDTDWVNLDNIRKGGTYDLPPILTGSKKGFWEMLISYTMREPGTEEFGSILKSKYGIADRSNSSNNYCDYIPCYEAIVSMVKFYRVGAKFCKGDPYAALFRANMRDRHPVLNILADGLYFENDFSLVRGHRNVYSGIEVNGVYYRLPAEQIVDTFMRLRNKKQSLYKFLMLIRLQASGGISCDVAWDILKGIRGEVHEKAVLTPHIGESFDKLTAKFDLMVMKHEKEKDSTGPKMPVQYGSSGWSHDQIEEYNSTSSEEEDEGGGDTDNEIDIAKMMSGLDSDPEIEYNDSSGDESENEEITIQKDFFEDLNSSINTMFEGLRLSVDVLTDEGNEIGVEQIYADLTESRPNFVRTAPYSLQHGESAVEQLEDERTFRRQIHFSEDRIVFLKELQIVDR
jgi:hypothetical protein